MDYTLVYDPDCGPCTRFKQAVAFLDPKGRVGFAGIGDAEVEGRLAGVQPARRRSSFHLVSRDGATWSGAGAFPELATLLPGGALLSASLTRCAPVRNGSRFVYEVLARLHDTGSCSRSAR